MNETATNGAALPASAQITDYQRAIVTVVDAARLLRTTEGNTAANQLLAAANQLLDAVGEIRDQRDKLFSALTDSTEALAVQRDAALLRKDSREARLLDERIEKNALLIAGFKA